MRAFFILILCLLAPATQAEGERAGKFDYYVLSLSWSPTWCALEGDARDAQQCRANSGLGWVLHGLWPQYHYGWPSYCQTVQRPPSRALTQNMADIMGSSGLAWYQWKKHGSCTGFTADAYFSLARQAYARVTRPEIFRKLPKAVKLPARVVEEAFLKANPEWEADMITITCHQGHIQEARLCLSKSLVPVPCGRDVIRDCQMKDAFFSPLR